MPKCASISTRTTSKTINKINLFSRYVDKNRLAAVSTGADLKADISHGRFGRRMEGEFQLGDPDDKVLFMSFYPEFIRIISRFYPDILETHLIQISSRFYLDFILILSG